MIKMDLDAMIKDVVGKILYNTRKKQDNPPKVYNEQVGQFLKRSHDVESFDFGKAWIVDKPKKPSKSKRKRKLTPREWVDAVEREMQLNFKNRS